MKKNIAIKTEGASAGSILAGKQALLETGAAGVTEIEIEWDREKINWTDSLVSLVALFELLAQAGYISPRDWKYVPSRLHQHFTTSGQEIGSSAAKQTKHGPTYSGRRAHLIDEILERLNRAAVDLERQPPEEK